MKKIVVSLGVLVFACCSGNTDGTAEVIEVQEVSQDYEEVLTPTLRRLHADGTRIVDIEGKEVRLRGVNLGGWLFHETWITLVGNTSHGTLYEASDLMGIRDEVVEVMREVGPSDNDDVAFNRVCPGNGAKWVEKLKPYLVARIGPEKADALLEVLEEYPPLCDDADLKLRRVLSKRFGDDSRDILMDTFQRAWVTESDIAWIAAQGFNVVRVPIGYRSLVRGPDLDKPIALEWNNLAFERLLELLSWCRKYGIYAVVDIQEAPGGQNAYAGKSGLFDDPKMQDLTVQLWEYLSDMLRDHDEVAAYSLLAEPYGAPNTDARDAMYDRLIKAIRQRGDDHLCVIHDGFFGMQTLPPPAKYGWTNVVYSTHFFEWQADLDGYHLLFEGFYETILTEAQEKQGVPYYIGSFSTVYDRDWAYEAAKLVVSWMERHGYSWSVWTYKRIDDPITKEVFGWSTAWGLKGRLVSEFVRPNPYVDDEATLKKKFEAYSSLRIDPNEALLSALKWD